MRLAAAHPDWVVGFLDECWWSGLALAALHSWAEEGTALRLVEKNRDKEDPDPVALACYGLLRFVEGRPSSEMSVAFLEWVCQGLQREGKKALLLVGDNASWPISQRVRDWLKEHNTTPKRQGGVRILSCLLPVKSPGLNPIEPRWVHAKRAIVEP